MAHHISSSKRFTLLLVALALTNPVLAVPGLNLSLPQVTPTPVAPSGSSNLPTLGNPTTQIISAYEDQQMGQEFIQQVRAQMPVLHDPIVNDYINNLGMRLVANAGMPGKKFTFIVINTPDINAFAGPGGYVAVNSGLILATHNESELASVMAHEIAHVVNNDIAQKTAQARRANISTLAAMLAGLAVAAAAGNSQIGSGVVGASLGTAINSQLGFSREAEQNADQVGMQILARSGFDPHAMPAFFTRLADLEKFSLQPPAFASDHPLTPDRIAYTTSLADQYPKVNIPSSVEYTLNRERVMVDLTQNLNSLLAGYKAALVKRPDSYATRYGYTLALTRNRDFAAATQEITPLIQQYPNQPLYPMALAEIKIAQDQAAAAIPILQEQLSLYPDDYPLNLEYAYALIRAKQANSAIRLLKTQLVYHPDDMTLYGLLAEAYSKSGNLAGAYLTRAQMYELNGDNEKALGQLHIALTMPKIDPETRMQIEAQIQLLTPKKEGK